MRGLPANSANGVAVLFCTTALCARDSSMRGLPANRANGVAVFEDSLFDITKHDPFEEAVEMGGREKSTMPSCNTCSQLFFSIFSGIIHEGINNMVTFYQSTTK